MSGIPLFSVGVISALYNDRFYKCFNIAFVPLIISFILLSAVFLCHPRIIANVGHSIADYAVVGTMILVFSKYNLSLKFPAVLGAITFDIYLVHFKILEIFKAFDFNLSIAAFIAATAVASIEFYLLRTRLLKLII